MDVFRKHVNYMSNTEISGAKPRNWKYGLVSNFEFLDDVGKMN